MKILAICPTIYPEKFSKMYDSFQINTSKYTKLLTINKKGGITKLINKAFERNPDYEFYTVINDDIIFETPLWDKELAKKGNVSHGTDAVEGALNGQFLMVDGDFCRSLGWLQMPTLNRYAGDVVWRFLGENTGTLRYVPEVKICHNWDGCSQPEVNKEDMSNFAQWLLNSHKDINKIAEVIKCHT